MCPPDAINKERIGAQDEGAPKIADEMNPDATYEASIEASAAETVGGIRESTIEATSKTASNGSPEDIDEMAFDLIDEETLKATDEEGSEVAGDVTLIKIDFERPSVAFVGATVDLESWTNALLPSIPATLDQDTIAWLWVLWRLQISSEFKKLSGVVQKQTKCRINEERNRYGVELPERIVGK
ncbi:hypothetical protein FSOLCH5_014338 [Fusarium solani]